jgi:hypothetical protein
LTDNSASELFDLLNMAEIDFLHVMHLRTIIAKLVRLFEAGMDPGLLALYHGRFHTMRRRSAHALPATTTPSSTSPSMAALPAISTF